MTRLATLPTGHFACQWCGGGVRTAAGPAVCPHCRMHPGPAGPVDQAAPVGTVGPAGPVDRPTPGPRRTPAARRGTPRTTPHQPATGHPVAGVDPGARYTGVVIRDGDTVLHASTIVRADGEDAVAYARRVVDAVRAILADGGWSEIPIAVEGVSSPKGFKNGARASLNPEHIMRAAVTLGAVAAAWPAAVVIPPGGNGSQHISHYPPELVGARPRALPGSAAGAGTRAHEQSAFDVAGKGAALAAPAPRLDIGA